MQALATTPAMKSQFDTQMNFLTELTQKSYESMRKLSELTMQMSRQMLEDSMNTSRQLLACTDPFQFSSTLMNQIQPSAERWRNYQQELMNVLAGAQVDLTRTTEAHLPEASRNAVAIADEMVRRGAEESEKMAARQRSAFDTFAGKRAGGDSSLHSI